MTPPALDWRSLAAKQRRMRDLLDRLAEVGPVDVGRLRDEPVTALAVERVLTLLVDLAFATNSHVAAARLGRVPESYATSFDLAAEAGLLDPELAAALRPSAGLRNVLVHAYIDVDPAAVAGPCRSPSRNTATTSGRSPPSSSRRRQAAEPSRSGSESRSTLHGIMMLDSWC